MTRIKDFALPDLGEGLVDGEILKWLVSVGDTVTQNQPIVEVETAKAAVEIPAKWPGQVTAIHCSEGDTVEVGTPIISIDTDPGAGPVPSAASLAAVEVAGDAPVEPGMVGGPAPNTVLVGYGPRAGAVKRRARTNGTAPTAVPSVVRPPAAPAAPVVAAPSALPAATAAPAPAAPPAPAVRSASIAVLAKPPVRKLAKDLGIDLATLTGSGPAGSITRADVLAAQAVPVVTPVLDQTAREQRIPVKGVRKLTAENMVSSAFTAPHVSVFNTVDVTRGMRALDRLRERREWREVRISPLLLVAKAVLTALKRHPMINSSWAGDEIVVKNYVNLGIAAATERGLIVPNIKDAQNLSLRELADALTGLVSTAKTGRTSPSDMAGGTFTITNVGVFGVDTGTPILPPGEAAILAVGAVREAAWAHKGKVRLRQVTTLSLSFDHRIIDGEQGSKFLRDVSDFLNDPEASLLSWT
jgi:pyruvate dehydrogenase E2 component (dihydrolipoamide acetyltransferase)